MPAFYNEGIAFFSETDDYIENYEKIAKDHLQHQEGTGENPFIPEDVWNEIERGTVERSRKSSLIKVQTTHRLYIDAFRLFSCFYLCSDINYS